MKGLLFKGFKVKQIRESKGLTQKDIEEMTGIKGGALSEMENGKNKNPRPATVEKLCGALGVDPLFFYFDGDNLIDLFPKEIPADVRDFLFNVENLEYIKLAMKIKNSGLKISSVENLIMAFAKSLNDHAQ